MKKNNKKGFTLAELLVVVAIIGVLTAIAIPVFSASTKKAKEAAVEANLRSCYAEATVMYMESGDITGDLKTGKKIDKGTYTATAVDNTITVTVELDEDHGRFKKVSGVDGKYDGKAFTPTRGAKEEAKTPVVGG